jgi:hypothetical protein
MSDVSNIRKYQQTRARLHSGDVLDLQHIYLQVILIANALQQFRIVNSVQIDLHSS